jgi:prephenate dehydrogenase
VIKKIVIIGVGLIGGSLAQAVKRAGFCQTIVGFDCDSDSLKKAVDLGVIDHYETNLNAAVIDADIVLMAVPMGIMDSVLAALADCLEPHTVITDVGSAKASVADSARKHLNEKISNFVPGHPIAGTEHSGVEASFAELYQNRRVILTPLNETSVAALELVRQMWQAAGATVEEMPVEQHDEVLAATSHLPHLLAYNLINTLIKLDNSEGIFRFSAGGFRDFTRIASSNPQMWRDIFLTNRQGVLTVLDQYMEDLARLRQAIDQSDGEYLLEAFAHAKAARDRHVVK